MARPRFFGVAGVPESGELPLSAADVHHLRDVLRASPGDEIVIVRDGIEHVVRVSAIGEAVTGEVLSRTAGTAVANLTLVQGLAKGEKMDDVVRQATEIGVARIVPFAAERSVVRLEGGRAAARVERWRRIAAEAAKQSRRASVPEIIEITDVDGATAAVAGGVVLVCWEDAEGAPGIGSALASMGALGVDPVAVVVGPEGGLTAGEVARFDGERTAVVSLGPTVLRTETAGVVASALALHSLGGLGAT